MMKVSIVTHPGSRLVAKSVTLNDLGWRAVNLAIWYQTVTAMTLMRSVTPCQCLQQIGASMLNPLCEKILIFRTHVELQCMDCKLTQ